MITIKFDENTITWLRDRKCNLAYLTNQMRYLADLFKYRGYIYLNNIYETLCVEWDPKQENVLWLYGQDEFSVAIQEIGDSNEWIVTINP